MLYAANTEPAALPQTEINLPPLLANLVGEQAVFMLRRD